MIGKHWLKAGFVCLLVGLSGIWGQHTAYAKDLLIVGGKVVDPAAQMVRSENMLIRDGKIIATFQGIPEHINADVFDASGKWIIPGLIDMHVHSFGNQGPNRTFDAPGSAGIAKRSLFAGVTGALDLFGDEETLYKLRKAQAEGSTGGAQIYASLSCLTAPNGHCTEYGVPTRTMSTPDEARETVADLAMKQPNVIKIVYQPTDDQPSIDKPTLKAAVKEAKEHGLKTIVHIKTWQDVRDVIEVGGAAITHVPYAYMPDDIPAAMAFANVAIIPTLAMHTDLSAYLYEESVLESLLAQAVASPALIAAYHDNLVKERYAERKVEWAERKKAMLVKVKTLADAGVEILAGTDAGNWGTIHGYSLHRELVHLNDAGLSTWDALRASTVLAGKFLGKNVGVRPQNDADLLVLEDNPLVNIEATQHIAAVIHKGNLVDRDALLAEAK